MRVAGAIFALVVVLLFSGRLLGLYTEYLWFEHDVQQPDVFYKTIGTQVMLWLATFIVAALVMHLSLQKALRLTNLFPRDPVTPQEAGAQSALLSLERFGSLLASAVSLVVAVGFANLMSAHVRELWLFQGATAFGLKDPALGVDVGFYVFQLPWYKALVGAALGLVVVTGILSWSGYLAIRALQMAAGLGPRQPAYRAHLSILAGAFLILLALRMVLRRFELLTVPGDQFTGPGFAQTQVLGAYVWVAGVTVLVGVLVLVNGWVGRPWRALTFGLPAVVVISVGALMLWPSITEGFKVAPNKNTIEKPFAQRAIGMTRFAYKIDQFEFKDFDVKPAPTAEEVERAKPTLEGMRLWDPNVLASSLSTLQAMRPYYAIYDVDLDRYTIDGKTRMVMVAPRDIHVDGLQANAQTWVNRRMVYTHGFGVVMVPVDEASQVGRPEYLISDLPPNSAPGAPKTEQPRVYFSNFPRGSEEYQHPLLMKTKQREFDYPTEDTDNTYRWTAERGIPVGGFLAKLALALKLEEMNLLYSSEVGPKSRIVMRRDVVDRASRVYPFLRMDSDPYIVVGGDRLYWIIDAYTTTRSLPYSERQLGPLGDLNYVRNSAKIVVDAYSGEMTAYAFDEKDPILRAYRKVFPQLILNRSAFPAAMLPHIRYGEDGLLYQCRVLEQYHVTDPVRFMLNNAAWQIASERGRGGAAEEILPYYVYMRLPGEDRESFVLILPFTPNQKPNMIGWLAAHCDPDRYGQVAVYKFSDVRQTQGPNQMEASFDQDPVIADINRQLNNDQSRIVPGNLLVIPLGSSILYVKPLFLESRTQGVVPVPELRKVILALQNRIVVGDTYEEALAKLFSSREPERPATAQPTVPSQAAPAASGSTVQQALEALDAADAALRAGDFAKYGETQKRAKELLRAALPSAP